MMREFKGVEKGITVYLNVNDIDTIQYVNPEKLKSDLIKIPGMDDRIAMCIVTTKSGNKVTVAATPEEILGATDKL